MQSIKWPLRKVMVINRPDIKLLFDPKFHSTYLRSPSATSQQTSNPDYRYENEQVTDALSAANEVIPSRLEHSTYFFHQAAAQTVNMDSDSRDQLIPRNDPRTPRWLLDLHNWRLERYIDIARTIATEGYGIFSYTWGYIADLDKP
ncbi:hypothetical protein BPOR_0012g00390 [Botrytis porri]|uniref:Heterokaryon incompatibility domain-containing protein n=1 Tax=Botrytis porri TaxID=87229 RepID=A0A4Z1L5C3_9HELO|nr:hypothetical protein BPOR_0012g00390 [Botrytis porri]